MRSFRILVFGLLFASTTGLYGQTADSLWEKVKNTYADCHSFSCTGTMVAEADPLMGKLPFKRERNFVIKFQRPDSLLVDWTDLSLPQIPAKRSVLFTKDGRVFGVPAFNPKGEEFPSLAEGLGAYAGISGGVTYLLPKLLLGDDGYFRVGTAELGEKTQLNGKDAQELKLSTPKNGVWTLTIDTATLAIGKAVRVDKLTKEDAEAARAEMIRMLRTKGLPVPDLPPAQAREIVSTTTFDETTFDPKLTPDDFAFELRKPGSPFRDGH